MGLMTETNNKYFSIIDYLTFLITKEFRTYPTECTSIPSSILEKATTASIHDLNMKYSGRYSISTPDELVEKLQVDPTSEANFYYRLEHEIFKLDGQNPALPYFAALMKRRCHCEIYYSTKIGPGFNIQHGIGTIIGPRYVIGANFMIHQGVTLGQKVLNNPSERIIIGDNVTIFAGAIVVGNLTVGDNSIIAANAVVLSDIEPNSLYAGVPAKRVK